MIVSTLPVIINKNAGRSYFHMNTSPRQKIDRSAPTIIAVAALLVNKVISAKGKIATFKF